MRQIKFRGLKVRASNDTEGFAYGHYTEGSPGWHYITTPDGSCFRVDPKSIGEYTGLKDKNGKEIYEGDIVKITDQYQDESRISEVVFKNAGFLVEANGFFADGEADVTTVGFAIDEDMEIEVLGNKFESPSLLTNKEKG